MARPSGAFVVALDVGTSSVRALLFDRRARPVRGAEVHLPYQPRVRVDGTAEVAVGKLMRLVEQALDGIVKQAGGREIRAVGMSTFWHGLVGAEDGGEPLTPLYLWSDTRSGDAARELSERIDVEAVRQRTGCTIHPSYWPAKLAWLRQERPDLWRRSVRWLSFADLVYERFCGQGGTSVSMASGTGLLKLADATWDAELLDILELEQGQLPKLTGRSGRLQRRYAKRWPALDESEWVPAAGDGALANLGSGCVEPTQRALTVGTSGALRVITDRCPQRLPRGIWCYRLDERRFVVGASFNNGGNLYAWMTRNLAVDEKRLEAAIRRVPVGAHGLTFLPLLAGERSPGFAPRATGAIAGLTQATTAADIARAGLEAIAVEFARADRTLDEVLPEPKGHVASGHGLLVSPAWMQITADALGRTLTASRAKEASARGAAVLALESASLLDAKDLDPGRSRDYRPDPTTADAYAAAMERQQALYRALVVDAILQPRQTPAHLQVRTRLG
jgi:gluconokinase